MAELVAVPNGGPAPDYGGGLTFSVVLSCLVAASGGLIFGYDIGISGGVSEMEPFLKRFFPHVLKRISEAKKGDAYCIYDSQALAAFTSSLYIAASILSPLYIAASILSAFTSARTWTPSSRRSRAPSRQRSRARTVRSAE
ncbi:unnamed protein product [Urochloa humidicola]